jgi:D-alanine transaminase
VLVHLNGELIGHEAAKISVFDRGFIFGDGVYEGLRAFRTPEGSRRVVGMGLHIERLAAGLAATGIRWDAGRLAPLTDDLLDANGLDNAFVYWQITRGTPDLSRGPSRTRVGEAAMTPTVFGYCSPLPPIPFENPEPLTKRASVQPDLRWLRGRIKSISLLGGVLAAIDGAAAHHADEAILVRDTPSGRLVSEGTYSNVVLVPRGSAEPVTPLLDDPPILDGVTRRILLHACPTLTERRIHAEELDQAEEVLLVGTTTMVSAVTHLDGRALPAPGPVSRALMRSLCRFILEGNDQALGTGGR